MQIKGILADEAVVLRKKTSPEFKNFPIESVEDFEATFAALDGKVAKIDRNLVGFRRVLVLRKMIAALAKSQQTVFLVRLHSDTAISPWSVFDTPNRGNSKGFSTLRGGVTR